MGKKEDTTASGEVNSRILLLILDELRHIRGRIDAALSLDNGKGSPPPPRNLPPARALNEDAPEVEILSSEVVDDRDAERAGPSTPESEKQSAPERPEDPAAFILPAPTSPDKEAELFKAQKQRIENMMSGARFADAERLAEALSAAIPDSTKAQALLETVHREASAFRTEQQSRLFREFQRWTESRQWIKAQTVGEQLLDNYPAGGEAKKVAASMSTVRTNAHIEEARTLRDRVGDMIKRKRYSEAVEIAEDLIHRFPKTQAAVQLRSLLPDLKKRSAQFR